MLKYEFRSSVCSTFENRHSTFPTLVLEQLLQQLGGDVLVLEAGTSARNCGRKEV